MGRVTKMNKSYSQAGQDMFAWAMSEGKTNGTFVDIGCNDPVVHSNTVALELLGWTGLCVDLGGFDYSCRPKTTFIQCDAANPTDKLALHYDLLPPVVDYLSLDVDEALISVIQKVPFDKVTFRIITLEHDLYCRGTEAREWSRAFLGTLGYLLVCPDVRVIPPGHQHSEPFEDWWVMPDLINPELLMRYQCGSTDWQMILNR